MENYDIIRRKLLSMISLSMRAGRITMGEDGCVKTLQNGRAKLILIAADASQNTRKKFADKSAFYDVPCYCFFTKGEIHAAIGKSNRATLSITCDNFSARMLALFKEMKVMQYCHN